MATTWHKIRRTYAQYAVLFNFYLFLGWFYVMLFLVSKWPMTEPFLSLHLPMWIAQASAWLLSLIGFESVSNGANVRLLDGFAFTIVAHCTGVYGKIIFASAVLAFPATIKEKLIGIGLGIPFLQMVNIARVSFLGIVGLYSREIFDFCHYWLLQGIFIAFIIVGWLAWRILVVKSESGAVVPS